MIIVIIIVSLAALLYPVLTKARLIAVTLFTEVSSEAWSTGILHYTARLSVQYSTVRSPRTLYKNHIINSILECNIAIYNTSWDLYPKAWFTI